jgi:hypothetical protein
MFSRILAQPISGITFLGSGFRRSDQEEFIYSQTLSRFSRPNICSNGLKGMGVAFALGPGKDIGGGDQFHIHQTSLLNGIQVLSLQESAADSSRP